MNNNIIFIEFIIFNISQTYIFNNLLNEELNDNESIPDLIDDFGNIILDNNFFYNKIKKKNIFYYSYEKIPKYNFKE
jgi:hypothetical protein